LVGLLHLVSGFLENVTHRRDLRRYFWWNCQISYFLCLSGRK